jgi:hypothetical protein
MTPCAAVAFTLVGNGAGSGASAFRLKMAGFTYFFIRRML